MPSWKVFERDVAKVLGGTRRPVTGLDRGDGDVFTDDLEIQVKKRAALPSINVLREWLDGIRATALRRERTGLVIYKPTGSRTDEALVVMTLGDFAALRRRANADHEELHDLIAGEDR